LSAVPSLSAEFLSKLEKNAPSSAPVIAPLIAPDQHVLPEAFGRPLAACEADGGTSARTTERYLGQIREFSYLH
jgi:hypothetical protein